MSQFLEQFENIDLEIHGIRLPKFKLNTEDYGKLDIPKGIDSLELFRLLVNRGFDKRIENRDVNLDRLQEYRDRLSYEMSVIEPTDFVDYMLIVWDVVNTAHNNNIAVGPGRGSAASSLVLYNTNITDIDPVEGGLYFERFLSEARTTPKIINGIKYYSDAADIDLDIEDTKREQLINILKEKYKGHFCKISTLGTLQSRKCIKEVSKIVLEYSEQQSLEISGMVPSLFGKVYPLKKAVEEVPAFAKFVKDNPKAYKIALKISELPVSMGSHASAYIISYEPLIDSIPCCMGESEMVTSFDMNYAMMYNIKLDLLGLKAVGIINEVCQTLGLKTKDFDLSYENVYSHLQDVKLPYGLFQISGDCNLRVVNKIKPQNLDHIAGVVALARPGALQFVDRYAKFVNEGECESTHPFFDEVLEPTAGLALYQESTMQMTEKIGLTKVDGESIRKGIGKKKIKEIEKWKDVIFKKAADQKLDPEIPKVLWRILEESASYSFNRSHSYSYGTLAAQTTYLKFKYPQHFYLACLRQAATRGDFLEHFEQIQHELPYFGIQLLPPNIAKSGLEFSIEGKDIRFGIAEIKGISDKSISKLQEFTSQSSSSDSDFVVFNAAKEAKLGIGIQSALIQSGALGHNIGERSKKVLEAQIWNLLTPKEKLYCLSNESKYDGSVITALKDFLNWSSSDGKKFTKQSRLETLRRDSSNYFKIFNLNHRNELLASYFYEKKLLGFSYSTTLKMIFGESPDYENIRNIKEIDEFVAVKDSYHLVATVKEVIEGTSKNGNKYLKLRLSDETGETFAMLLGDKLARYLEKLSVPQEEDIVSLVGQKGDSILWINKMEVQNVKVYTKLSDLKNLEKEEKTA